LHDLEKNKIMGVHLKSFKTYTEEKTSEIIVSFGRFNPPTRGHEENIEAIAKLAKGKPFRIYASQSEDPKKNPLGYEEKIKFMRKMFPQYGRNIILDRSVKNVFDIATSAYDEGYTRFTVAVGSDRVEEFKALLRKYDGVKGTHGYYKFPDGINIVSTGQRDPDIDSRTGASTFAVSASKMRSAAADNDLETFAKGVPKTYGDVKDLFNAVRKGMGLKESHSFRKHVQFDTLSETRERYISGEIYNVGDSVVTIKDNVEYKIASRGPNYVTCVNETEDKQVKFFIHDIREKLMLDEETWEAGYERRVVKVTKPDRLEAGYKWRIKGKDDSSRTIKYYKDKPDFEEFKAQMQRVAGHEFGTR
jgi:uncharacterized protein YbcV (DUF1398 family)